MNNINTIELFCGIGGFRIACDNLGIKTRWANDLSQESCQVYANAFGDSEVHCGDIKTLKSEIPKHDLLSGGFPCQPFSSAGKKLGTKDTRGTLFQEIVDVLETHKPKWFILENVKRLLTMDKGDHFATILSALSELDYFIEWRLLNAQYFGLPQNRQRVVIVGTRCDKELTSRLTLVSPDDIEHVVHRDYEQMINPNSWCSLKDHRKSFASWGLCYKGTFFARDINQFSARSPQPSLDTVLEQNPAELFFMDESTKERIQNSIFVNKLVGGVRILYNQKGGARMGYTVFGTDGVAPALTASHSRHYERYKVGDRYRRLTNIEYARLQGFPDQHCEGVSVFNQYGLYGNAVPPPMVEWSIRRLIQNDSATLDTLPTPDSFQMNLAV